MFSWLKTKKKLVEENNNLRKDVKRLQNTVIALEEKERNTSSKSTSSRNKFSGHTMSRQDIEAYSAFKLSL